MEVVELEHLLQQLPTRVPPLTGDDGPDQTVWTWNRLVVPGAPLGSPAVMPTR